MDLKFQLPPPDIIIVDPMTGRFTNDGYDLFKTLERILTQLQALKITDLADFDNSTPATNTQVPIWNSGSGKWKPGAN